MNPPLYEALARFFGNLRGCVSSPAQGDSSLSKRLPVFFTALHACLPDQSFAESAPAPEILLVDVDRLKGWLSTLREPTMRARAQGVFCDPWRVAKLGRDEVRNAAVLAWILDPRGDHGHGNIFLCALIDEINRRNPPQHLPLPNESEWVNVRPESYLDSELKNRVDIEVNAAALYLLVEVKIKAVESEKQMEGYGDHAEKLAGNRPWRMVYLTRSGNPSQTAGRHKSRVTAISWANLARVWRRALDRQPSAPGDAFSSRLIELYFRHAFTI